MTDPRTATDGAKQIARDIAEGLRRAIQTEVNDDMTVQGTDFKVRFIQRVNAMSDAADFLMEFANGRAAFPEGSDE